MCVTETGNGGMGNTALSGGLSSQIFQTERKRTHAGNSKHYGTFLRNFTFDCSARLPAACGQLGTKAETRYPRPTGVDCGGTRMPWGPQVTLPITHIHKHINKLLPSTASSQHKGSGTRTTCNRVDNEYCNESRPS